MQKRKYKLLFVCLGNICRSPAAEGIFNHIVSINQKEDLYHAESAGIGHWHVGELPDSRMRTHGKRHGYDFNSRARQFSPKDFDHYDIIVAMDEQNASDIKSMARSPYDLRKIRLMAQYLRHHPMHRYIPDPYYGGDEQFELVIELLEDACMGLFDSLQE
ncbi:MAG: low molecular weight phosphotyrosine protein phosphatase [Prevotella sp.]|nr:low molecular weight phosphotyrosine protein phosphatase [Prevotella sp.]